MCSMIRRQLKVHACMYWWDILLFLQYRGNNEVWLRFYVTAQVCVGFLLILCSWSSCQVRIQTWCHPPSNTVSSVSLLVSLTTAVIWCTHRKHAQSCKQWEMCAVTKLSIRSVIKWRRTSYVLLCCVRNFHGWSSQENHSQRQVPAESHQQLSPMLITWQAWFSQTSNFSTYMSYAIPSTLHCSTDDDEYCILIITTSTQL